MMTLTIRPERREDHQAIHDVTQRAFAQVPYADGDEQLLPDRFRRHGALACCLVAEQNGEVVGQVTLTHARAADGSPGWFTLGPIAVDPPCQSQGIGGQLINAAIIWMRGQQGSGCILLGNPAYYSRFGWQPCPGLAPEGIPADYFQVLPFGMVEPMAVFAFDPLFFAEA